VSAPATATTPEQAATAAQVEALTRRLRLPYLRAAAAETLATARAQRWDPTEVLRVVLTAEADGRATATTRNRRRRAGFPSGKTFHTWDAAASSIPPGAQHVLRTLEWVARRENLCLAGPSGTGKSHFLEALGHHAIDEGYKVT
jgi:DNA replication protein DnaC